MIFGAQHSYSANNMEYAKGDSLIAAAGSGWADWKIIHTEKRPFVNEMPGDVYRWKNDRILSVMVQEMPSTPHEPTLLRIPDFKLKNK